MSELRPPADAAPGPPLPLGRHLALVWRSLLLQASWSFERMQSVGFAAALSGEGRRLAREAAGPAGARGNAGVAPDMGREASEAGQAPPGAESRAAARAFLERHLGYFNTNPPMASYLIGAAIRLEEAAAAGRPGALADLARFQRAAVSALASWGDRLFWATLRPVATVVAVLLAWLLLRFGAGAGGAGGGAPSPSVPILAAASGAAAYLIVYNAAHLHYRVRGIQAGYRWGAAVAARVGKSPIRRLPDTLRAVGLVALGLLAPLAAAGTHRGLGLPGTTLCLLAAALLALHLRRRAVLGWGWGLVAVGVGLLFRLAAPGR